MLRRHDGDDSELSEVSDSGGAEPGHEGASDPFEQGEDFATQESGTSYTARVRAADSVSSSAAESATAAAIAAATAAASRRESARSSASAPVSMRLPNTSANSLIHHSHPAPSSRGSPPVSPMTARHIPLPHTRTQSATSPLATVFSHRSPPASPTPQIPPRSRSVVNSAGQAPFASTSTKGSSGAQKPVAGKAMIRHPTPSSPSGHSVSHMTPAPHGSTSPGPDWMGTPHFPAQLIPDPATHHADRPPSHVTPERSPSLLGRTQSGLKRSFFGSLRRKKAPEPLKVSSPPAAEKLERPGERVERAERAAERTAPPSAWSARYPATPGRGAHIRTVPSSPAHGPDSPSAVAGERILPAAAASGPPTGEVSDELASQLWHYGRMLSSTAGSVSVPGVISQAASSPPRQLLRAVPVFQVVNASGIKDRFLFVFSDLIVLAKPIASPDGGSTVLGMADLSWTFNVKTIFDLRNVRLSIPKEHATDSARPHPLMRSLVSRFPRDADGAVQDVLLRSGLLRTASNIAQLLAQTPDLDKDVLTAYLCDPRHGDVLDAYISAQPLVGVSVESALRAFLLGVRYPLRYVEMERLLRAFAARWVEANAALIKPGFSKEIATVLVLAMFRLNDAMYSGEPDTGGLAPGYLYPDAEAWIDPRPDEFVSYVRAQDLSHVLSDQTVLRIYASIRTEPLATALSSSEQAPLPVSLTSPMPATLISNQPSPPVTVMIPHADRDFAIRLYGQDIHFDPPVLTFTHSPYRTFTMQSRSLGPRQVVFIRAGRKSRYYAGTYMSSTPATPADLVPLPGSVPLPRSASVTVERAFMQHTFLLTSTEGTASRRYMFSVEDDSKRDFITDVVGVKIDAAHRAASSTASRDLAHSIALDTLHDSLIDGFEADLVSLQRSASAGATFTTPSRTSSRTRLTGGRKRAPSNAGAASSPYPPPAPSRGGTIRQALEGLTRRLDRSASTVVRQGHGRADSVRDPERGSSEKQGAPRLSAAGSAPTLTGNEIVRLCQHNSLLPLVLSHLES